MQLGFGYVGDVCVLEAFRKAPLSAGGLPANALAEVFGTRLLKDLSPDQWRL